MILENKAGPFALSSSSLIKQTLVCVCVWCIMCKKGDYCKHNVGIDVQNERNSVLSRKENSILMSTDEFITYHKQDVSIQDLVTQLNKKGRR